MELMNEYNWYKSRGICVNCHQENAIRGKVHCPNCNDDRNLKAIEYWNENKNSINSKRRQLRQYRIKNKLCTKCGSNLSDDYNYKMCSKCLKREKSYSARKKINKLNKWDLWKLENKCVRCGAERYEESKLCKRCYDISVKNIKEAKGYREFTRTF